MVDEVYDIEEESMKRITCRNSRYISIIAEVNSNALYNALENNREESQSQRNSLEECLAFPKFSRLSST